MDNSIYEVTRDEYVGFIDQIKPECRLAETIEENGYNFIKLYSVETGTHFATRIIPIEQEDEIEHYYIFNMPLDSERRAPKPVRKIILESKEEVQAFVDVLAKWQKENKNGRTIC